MDGCSTESVLDNKNSSEPDKGSGASKAAENLRKVPVNSRIESSTPPRTFVLAFNQNAKSETNTTPSDAARTSERHSALGNCQTYDVLLSLASVSQNDSLHDVGIVSVQENNMHAEQLPVPTTPTSEVPFSNLPNKSTESDSSCTTGCTCVAQEYTPEQPNIDTRWSQDFSTTLKSGSIFALEVSTPVQETHHPALSPAVSPSDIPTSTATLSSSISPTVPNEDLENVDGSIASAIIAEVSHSVEDDNNEIDECLLDTEASIISHSDTAAGFPAY